MLLSRYHRSYASKVAASAFYIFATSFLAQGNELPQFTRQMFKDVTNEKLVTEEQRIVLFSRNDDFLSFLSSPAELLKMIAKDENIPTNDTDYILDFSGTQDDPYHHRGLLDFSYSKDASQFIFRIFAFNNPNLVLKGTPYRGGIKIFPNIKAEFEDGFFSYPSKEEYKLLAQMLAGTAVCTYSMKDPTTLRLRSLSIHPYTFIYGTETVVKMKGQEGLLKYEGLVVENVGNRLNKLYDLLGCFAKQIVKTKQITLNNMVLNLHPLVIAKLTTEGPDGTCFIETQQNSNIYSLKTDNAKDSTSQEDEWNEVL